MRKHLSALLAEVEKESQPGVRRTAVETFEKKLVQAVSDDFAMDLHDAGCVVSDAKHALTMERSDADPHRAVSFSKATLLRRASSIAEHRTAKPVKARPTNNGVYWVLVEAVELNISEPALFASQRGAKDEMARRFAEAMKIDIPAGSRPSVFLEQTFDNGDDEDTAYLGNRAFCQVMGENHTWHVFRLEPETDAVK